MRYVQLRITTFGGGISEPSLTLKEFLLLRKGVWSIIRLPPVAILNQFLELGNSGTDAGDLIEWAPFAIHTEEYLELVSSFEEKYVARPEQLSTNTSSLRDWIDFGFTLFEKEKRINPN